MNYPIATIDVTDDVDLGSSTHMSFSLLDAASLIFSISSFFLDFTMDIAVACFHYLNQDYWYCSLTLAFMMIPNYIIAALSLRWFIVDCRGDNSEPVKTSQWAITILFHFFQLAPVLRYYKTLQAGIEFRNSTERNDKKKAYRRIICEDADATLLRLFESFLESAPQLMLQVYIITRNYPFDDYEYWTGEYHRLDVTASIFTNFQVVILTILIITVIFQVMSISSSLISISWSLVSYSKSLRLSLPNKAAMSYKSIVVLFLREFFAITSRMLALALFISAFVRSACVVCIAHWAFMTAWVATMETKFCSTKLEELGFNAIIGFIFIFCYFNPVDNPTRYRYCVYYIIIFLENTILLKYWADHVSYHASIVQLAIEVHYTLFLLALVSMVSI